MIVACVDQWLKDLTVACNVSGICGWPDRDNVNSKLLTKVCEQIDLCVYSILTMVLYWFAFCGVKHMMNGQWHCEECESCYCYVFVLYIVLRSTYWDIGFTVNVSVVISGHLKE